MMEAVTATLKRPQQSEIRAKWISLFSHPEITLQDLRDEATFSAGLGQEEDDLGGVTLRSVYWRIYLGTLPLEALQSGSNAPLRSHLQAQRRNYDLKREKWLKAPDGRWASDCSVPEGEPRGQSGSLAQSGTAAWDPLNLGEENPWQAWFQNAELRKTIEKDVERTFPEIEYFLDDNVRKVLTTILFLWSIEHEEVGYRQGMHELLATILMIVDRDGVTPIASDSTPSPTFSPLQENSSSTVSRLEESLAISLDRRFVQHDVYALFCRLMETGKDWYEWRTESMGTSTLQRRAKIVDMCEQMQDSLLKRVDPILHAKFAAEGIEGQLWGIRYIRLLFTREMPFSSAMRIWDGLFAADGRLDELVQYVCVAMLLRIRHLLLPSDYPGVLTLLLKYPGHDTDLPLNPTLLLQQARSIRDNPSPSTGAAISLQNQETLGIPAYEPDGTESIPSVSHHDSLRSRQRSAPASSPSIRSPAASARGYGFESLARGFMERAQASGIDKTILSTVSEIRKNLPDFTPPTAPTFPFRTFSSEPSSELLYDNDLPSPGQAFLSEPARTLLDAEREIAELRLVMIGMGKAMGGWLEVIHPPGQPAPRPPGEHVERAWTGLQRLQESLLDGGAASTNDLARVWAWSQDLQSISTPASIQFNASRPPEQTSPTLTLNRGNMSPRVTGGMGFGVGPPASPNTASFNAPRNPRPESVAMISNSPRQTTGFPSPRSPTFTASAYPNASREVTGRFATRNSNSILPVYVEPQTAPTSGEPPFEMPKSADYTETIDLQPPKKVNVDPLLGLGV